MEERRKKNKGKPHSDFEDRRGEISAAAVMVNNQMRHAISPFPYLLFFLVFFSSSAAPFWQKKSLSHHHLHTQSHRRRIITTIGKRGEIGWWINFFRSSTANLNIMWEIVALQRAEPNRNLIETDVFKEAVSWTDFSKGREIISNIIF